MEQFADDVVALLDALQIDGAGNLVRFVDGRLHRLSVCPQVCRG